MTEKTVALAHHEAQPVTAVVTVDVTGGMSFTEMVRMGDELVRTGFLPDHIRNGAQFAAIVLDGRERGMLPMRAVRSLQMVKGKVLESADSQLARFKSDGGRAVFRKLDETGATLWLRHPNGDEHVEEWTPDDSKRAGLAGGNHGKFPKAMFRSRAITAGLKSVGWEGSTGTYDPSEFDMADVGAPSPQDLRATVEPEQQQPAADHEKQALRAEISKRFDSLGVPPDDRAAEVERILGKRPANLDDLRLLNSKLREKQDEPLKTKIDDAAAKSAAGGSDV